jgi:hypothetical protein
MRVKLEIQQTDGEGEARMSWIEHVQAREILDSRGNPTVEAEVILADGA